MAATQTSSPRPATIQLSVARNRLATIWLGSAGAIFLLLVVQTFSGHFEDKSQDVWSWMLPTIMPTLTLMVTVLGADALKAEGPDMVVKSGFFRLALIMSVFYLFLVVCTLLVEPLTSIRLPDLLKLSNLWLGPLQGLVTSALGLLFFSKRRGAESSGDES